jgi:hypothetical protein
MHPTNIKLKAMSGAAYNSFHLNKLNWHWSNKTTKQICHFSTNQ